MADATLVSGVHAEQPAVITKPYSTVALSVIWSILARLTAALLVLMHVLLPAGFAPPGEVHFHADLFDSAVSPSKSMLTLELFGQLHI